MFVSHRCYPQVNDQCFNQIPTGDLRNSSSFPLGMKDNSGSLKLTQTGKQKEGCSHFSVRRGGLLLPLLKGVMPVTYEQSTVLSGTRSGSAYLNIHCHVVCCLLLLCKWGGDILSGEISVQRFLENRKERAGATADHMVEFEAWFHIFFLCELLFGSIG